MTMDILKSGLATQLARNNLPSENRTQIQNAYNLINNHSQSSKFNDLGSITTDLQQTSSFIHCDDMASILGKFNQFDSLLGTVIDDAFGDNLSAITSFISDLGDSLAHMQIIQDGLSAVKTAMRPLLSILKTATDMISDAPDNPCLKAIATKSYSYMSSENRSIVDNISSISSPADRNSYMNQMMKSTSTGKFF